MVQYTPESVDLGYRDAVSESPPLVSRFWPHAIIGAIVLGALAPLWVSVVLGSDVRQLGGDFSSFYVAGEIVLDGDVTSLYDASVQQERQTPYHSGEGEFLYFAYPPFVAFLYAAIAWLPYSVAFALHGIAALAALGGAIAILVRRHTGDQNWRRNALVGTAVALMVQPIATAVLGGQNTTFTLLLAALAFAGGAAIPQYIAGVAGGMMLYKPQFGVLMFAVLGLTRRWRAMAWMLAVGLVLYASAVPSLGWAWPSSWADAVLSFGEQNQDVNGFLMVNALGWWRAVTGGMSGMAIATIVSISIPVLYVLVTEELTPRSEGVVAAWMIVASASTLFYDAGLALVFFGLFVLVFSEPLWLLPLVVAGSWTQVFARDLGWSPLFPIVVGLIVFQLVRLMRSRAFVS